MQKCPWDETDQLLKKLEPTKAIQKKKRQIKLPMTIKQIELLI